MPTVQTGRIICGALFGGIVMIWALALFLTEGGQAPLDPAFPLDPSLLTVGALLMGVAGFAAALVFRSRALASVSSLPGRDAEPPASKKLSALQSNLIIAWALLEGFALFMGVFFMLTTLASLLIITVAIVVPGFALTFPRTEWYGQAQAASGVRSWVPWRRRPVSARAVTGDLLQVRPPTAPARRPGGDPRVAKDEGRRPVHTSPTRPDGRGRYLRGS